MKRNHSHTLLRRLHFAVCVGLLTFVSWALLTPNPFASVRSTPLSPLSALRTVSDVLLHCGAYGLLTFVCYPWVANRQSVAAKRILPGLLMAHGICSELLQALVPNRNSDPLDAMANMLGIVIGTIAATWFYPALRHTKILLYPTQSTDPLSVEI
ncbi:MAG: VanZ family protein [Fuerstiella sp.]|jgi:VanZ family protein